MYASYEVGPSWFATSPGVSPDSPPAFGTKPRPELPDDLPVKRTRNRASIPAAKNSEAARTPVRALVIDSPLVACPSWHGPASPRAHGPSRWCRHPYRRPYIRSQTTTAERRFLGADRGACVDQSGTVGVRERDRVGLVDVAEAGRAGRARERRRRVRRVVRPHVVHEARAGRAPEPSEERIGSATEIGACGERQRGDACGVRRRHRRALQPAEALSAELEARRVEERRRERVCADQALVLERAERAPAAEEDVALAAAVGGDLVAAGAARSCGVDARAGVRVVGEVVARADVLAPAKRNRSGGCADRVRGRGDHRYARDARRNHEHAAQVEVRRRVVAGSDARDAFGAERDAADA